MTDRDQTIDEALATLRDSLSMSQYQIRQHEAQLAEMRIDLASTEGQIAGLERARELFGLTRNVTPAAEPPRERHSVQRVILAALASCPGMSEVALINRSSLPASSVHKFLVRAVRDGKLRFDQGVYSLPEKADG